MKTCAKCHVTKAKEGFYAANDYGKLCKKGRRKVYLRTSKFRLRTSYEACKRRHVFKLNSESKMISDVLSCEYSQVQGERSCEE